MVQWLRLHASTVEGTNLILGWGTKILSAAQHDQKKIFLIIKKIKILIEFIKFFLSCTSNYQHFLEKEEAL